jgi:hypothetical protein
MRRHFNAMPPSFPLSKSSIQTNPSASPMKRILRVFLEKPRQ